MEKRKEIDPKLKDKILQYKSAFNSTEGKLVLEDLKVSLGYGETIYVPGNNREDTFFHLGRQSVINDILKLIDKEI